MFHVARPGRFSAEGCVILPGRHADPHGFIDTTTELEGVHGPIRVYLSIAGIRRIAQQFPEQTGLVPAEDVAKALDEAEAAREEVQRLTAEVERLKGFRDSIAGIRREGFQVSKIKGPRPTTAGANS